METVADYKEIVDEIKANGGERFSRCYQCGLCDAVCPWNRFARICAEPDFAPRHRLDSATLVDLFAWSEAQFLQRTEGSAIRRIGYRCWLRNLAVALGNAPSSEKIRKALLARAHHDSDTVSEHIAWALERQALGFERA